MNGDLNAGLNSVPERVVTAIRTGEWLASKFSEIVPCRIGSDAI